MLKYLRRPCEHERRILARFSGNVLFEGCQPVFGTPLMIVLFTNRCGSNLFCDYLRKTGFVGGLRESLNHQNVDDIRTKYKLSSFPELMSTCAGKHILEGRYFGVKASVGQLAMLVRWNIPAMFSGMVVYSIVREDLLNQAISKSIAMQTGKWSSTMKREATRAPEFNFAAITKFIETTIEQNAAGRILVDALDFPSFLLRYEELVADPEPHIRGALSTLGINANDVEILKPTLEKQANEVNAQFRAQYLRSLSLEIMA